MAKRILARLALFAALCSVLCGTALGVGVEQIQVSLPSITVYIHAEDADFQSLSAGDITATLNGSPLQVEGFAPSDQGICYIFMLDISRSIPKAHLEAAKQAIRDICTSLRPQDKLALIRFGNEVTILSSGDESTEDVLKKLDLLQPTDNNTKFYNAMDTLVELSVQMTDLRRIAVVVSDGIDDTDAGMTQGELENVLKQSGIAVYALCVDTASQTDTAKFRSFIHLTGGELYPFGPDNAKTVLDQLVNRLGNVWMLQLLSLQAMETPDSVPLAVDFGGLAQLTAELEPDYWVPDQSPPYVTNVEADPAALSITVEYSEPVSGADSKDSYRLTDGKNRTVEITAAAYTDASRRSIRLTVPDLEKADACVLNVSGPTDLSANQNALIPYQGEIGDADTGSPADSAPASSGVQKEEASVAREMRNLILGALAAIAAVILLVLLIVVNARRRQHFDAGGGPTVSAVSAQNPKNKDEEKKKRREKPKTHFFFTDEK